VFQRQTSLSFFCIPILPVSVWLRADGYLFVPFEHPETGFEAAKTGEFFERTAHMNREILQIKMWHKHIRFFTGPKNQINAICYPA